jgi:nitroreductase
VPRGLIEKVIYAATRASSPGNSQGWDFVVVTERATKAKLGPVLRERMLPMVQGMPATPGVVGRMLGGAQHLLKSFEDVPV